MTTPDQPDLLELAPGVRIPPDAVTVTYTTSRGPGGQNVNKRATRAEMRIGLADIPLTPRARSRLRRMAGQRLTDDGQILITADEHRSQRRNREACLQRLRELVLRARTEPKPRKPTAPTKGSVRRRLEAKRQRGELKRRRQNPPDP